MVVNRSKMWLLNRIPNWLKKSFKQNQLKARAGDSRQDGVEGTKLHLCSQSAGTALCPSGEGILDGQSPSQLEQSARSLQVRCGTKQKWEHSSGFTKAPAQQLSLFVLIFGRS